MVRCVVLVIGGDAAGRRFLRDRLETEGYQVSALADGRKALRRLEGERPDLVLIDAGPPGADGLGLLKLLRERTPAPIIALAEDCQGVIAALDGGADDCLARPYNVEELLARLRALLRRSLTLTEPARKSVVDLGNVAVDLSGRRLLVAGNEVSLSRTEWQLLYHLATNLDRVLMHRELLSRVWGPQFADDVQYLRVWVCRLRHKLGDHLERPRYLVTIPGVGYRLTAPLSEREQGTPPGCTALGKAGRGGGRRNTEQGTKNAGK